MTGRKIDLEAEIDATHKEILDMLKKNVTQLCFEIFFSKIFQKKC